MPPPIPLSQPFRPPLPLADTLCSPSYSRENSERTPRSPRWVEGHPPYHQPSSLGAVIEAGQDFSLHSASRSSRPPSCDHTPSTPEEVHPDRVRDGPEPMREVLEWIGQPEITGKLSLNDVFETARRRGGGEHEMFAEHTSDSTSQRVAQLPRFTPPKRSRSQPAPAADIGLVECSPVEVLCGDRYAQVDGSDEEEHQWVLRKEQTGAICRLVHYADSDVVPIDDFIIRGGGEHPVSVADVHAYGPAAKAGVCAGDRLVSIDGRKDFVGLPLEKVCGILRTPATLVFMGFMGKVQAEVRLTTPNKPFGLHPRHDVTLGAATLTLCEETVFRSTGTASVFLTTDSPVKKPAPLTRVESWPAPASPKRASAFSSALSSAVFELRSGEAKQLVDRALRLATLQMRTCSPESTPRPPDSDRADMADLIGALAAETVSDWAPRIGGKPEKPMDPDESNSPVLPDMLPSDDDAISSM